LGIEGQIRESVPGGWFPCACGQGSSSRSGAHGNRPSGPHPMPRTGGDPQKRPRTAVENPQATRSVAAPTGSARGCVGDRHLRDLTEMEGGRLEAGRGWQECLFAASEARAAGWGGVAAVPEITGLARSRMICGLKDLDGPALEPGRGAIQSPRPTARCSSFAAIQKTPRKAPSDARFRRKLSPTWTCSGVAD
jgi:hypothetical protein